MPTYIKTGYWDKLSKAPKGYLNLDLITGGGGVTSVTKTEFDALVSSNGLTPGAYYLISGVDVPLYGGTDILIQAATSDKLALAGHGIFYNPKYQNSQLTPNNGYGIWNNYITLTMSNIVGTFTKGDIVTANNGATATYLAEGFFSWISGNWSLATSIDNGLGATADVSGGVSPSYAIGQDVIWGGKHWTNTSGSVGSADDKYTLSAADWTAVPFDDINYNVVADVIHYDQSHDMIIRRKDKWDNDVDGTFQWFYEVASPDGYDYGNPIKDFQWGNGPEDFNTDDYYYIGVQSNYVKDSYLECINFVGSYLWFNRLTEQSIMVNNITDVTSGTSYNILSSSFLRDNILYNNSAIDANTLSFSSIYDNTLSSSYFNANYLNVSSSIFINILNISNIFYNSLSGSSIGRNNLNTYSHINYNSLNTQSDILYVSLNSGSYIDHNNLNKSSFRFIGTLASKYVFNISAEYSYIDSNISAATIIYGYYTKQIFTRQDGLVRLGYYNASDVFTVVDVNA